MGIAKNRIHIICGFCGCKDEFEFYIDQTGNCNNSGVEYPSVNIVCKNCSSLTGLDEVIKEKATDSAELSCEGCEFERMDEHEYCDTCIGFDKYRSLSMQPEILCEDCPDGVNCSGCRKYSKHCPKCTSGSA